MFQLVVLVLLFKYLHLFELSLLDDVDEIRELTFSVNDLHACELDLLKGLDVSHDIPFRQVVE